MIKINLKQINTKSDLLMFSNKENTDKNYRSEERLAFESFIG